jgi:anaphase-promoting complex subunit 6
LANIYRLVYSFIKKCKYQKAVQWFELTLDHTSSSLNEMWEPALVNLGHALRKLK